jgi:hypothetical protein
MNDALSRSRSGRRQGALKRSISSVRALLTVSVHKPALDLNAFTSPYTVKI